MVMASEVLARSSGKSHLPGLRLVRNVVGTVGRVPASVFRRLILRKKQTKALREKFQKTNSKIPQGEKDKSILLCEDVAAAVRWPRYITPSKDYTDEKLEGLRGSINMTEVALSWYIGEQCLHTVRYASNNFQHMTSVVDGNGDLVITIDAGVFVPETATDKGSIEYVFSAPNAQAIVDKLKLRHPPKMFAKAAKAGDCAVM